MAKAAPHLSDAPHLAHEIARTRPLPAKMRGKSLFNVGEDLKSKHRGKVISWVSLRANGFEARDTHMMMWGEGWRHFPLNEFDIGYMKDYRSPYGDDKDNDMVVRGGQVLMYRDKELNDIENEQYVERTNTDIMEVKKRVPTEGMTNEQYDEYQRRFQLYKP